MIGPILWLHLGALAKRKNDERQKRDPTDQSESLLNRHRFFCAVETVIPSWSARSAAWFISSERGPRCAKRRWARKATRITTRFEFLKFDGST